MIKTGGRRFDPDEGPVYFLATGASNFKHFNDGRCDTILIAMDQLEGPAAVQRTETFADENPGARIFLDSGIFALTNAYAREHAISMDDALTLAPQEIGGFDELLARYIERVKAWEDILWGYVEVDQGGADNKRATRELLHAEGLKPIPVYHPLLDGWDYFDELAEGHDRICFGNIVQSRQPERIRLLATCAERCRVSYPKLWVHLLGMSPHPWMFTWPVNSCDSSSWMAGMRWVQGPQTFSYNRTYDLNDLGWRYDYDDDTAPRTTAQATGPSRDKAAALSVHESHYANLAWRAIVARRTELGEHR